MENKKRITYLDSLKGFAIICVVLGHVADGILTGNTYPAFESTTQTIFNVIYSFHMPLFFLISGYFFSLAYIKRSECGANVEPKWDKLKWQISNIVIIFFLFSLIMTLFKMALSSFCNTPLSFDAFLNTYRCPVAPYWYLYVLFFLYLFFALTVRFFQHRWVAPAIGLTCMGLTLLPLPTSFEVWRIIYHAPFFLLGLAFQQHMLRPRWLLSVGIIALSFAAGPLQKFTLALGLSMLIWQIFEHVKCLDNKLLLLCGRYCLEIYLIHCMLTSGFRTVLPMVGLGFYPIAVVLNTVLSTAIPVGVAMLLEKMGVHDWVFRPAYMIKRGMGK